MLLMLADANMIVNHYILVEMFVSWPPNYPGAIVDNNKADFSFVLERSAFIVTLYSLSVGFCVIII